MKLLQGEKTVGQVAKAYGVHPNLASVWRWQFLDKGPEVFAEDNTIQEYKKHAELEQLLGKKELEIALSTAFRAGECAKKLLGAEQMDTKKKVDLVVSVQGQYDLPRVQKRRS